MKARFLSVLVSAFRVVSSVLISVFFILWLLRSIRKEFVKDGLED